MRVKENEMRSLGFDMLKAAGAPAEEAEIIIEILLDASLRGIDSHGVRAITRYIREIRKRKVLKDFIYITWDEERIVVPKNFLFDGGSIPWLFRPIVGGPWSDDVFEASCVHDWLCQLAKCSRSRADSIFSQIMAERNVFPLKRKVMYLGVRIGSFGKWVSGLWKK